MFWSSRGIQVVPSAQLVRSHRSPGSRAISSRVNMARTRSLEEQREHESRCTLCATWVIRCGLDHALDDGGQFRACAPRHVLSDVDGRQLTWKQWRIGRTGVAEDWDSRWRVVDPGVRSTSGRLDCAVSWPRSHGLRAAACVSTFATSTCRHPQAWDSFEHQGVQQRQAAVLCSRQLGHIAQGPARARPLGRCRSHEDQWAMRQRNAAATSSALRRVRPFASQKSFENLSARYRLADVETASKTARPIYT